MAGELRMGTEGKGATFERRRQVTVDTESLVTVIYTLVYLGIFLFLLNWFYQAVKRIEKSLQGIEKRLEAIETNPTQPAPNETASVSPAAPRSAKKIERVSNMWGIPAILFIAALFTGSLGLTSYLLWGAGAMVVAAGAWEVVRREIRP